MSGGADILAAATGATISGGFGLLGGMMANEYNDDQRTHNENFQKWLLNNSLQTKMEDAKRAGIHPLYAIGQNPPPTFPVAMEDNVGPALRDMGQGLGNAVTRMMDSQQREKHQLDMALGAAQLAESDARKEMYLSEAARNRQAPGAPMPGLGIQKEIPDGTVRGQIESMGQDPAPTGVGIIDIKPSEQTSTKEGEPDVIAGQQAGYEERNFRGMPMLFPRSMGESPEEIISEMSLGAYLGLLKLNANTYGGNWIEDFMKLRYLGENPTEKYPNLNEQKGMTRSYGEKSTLQKAIEPYTGKRQPPWRWQKHYEGR